MKHFHTSIQGWCDFEGIYRDAVRGAPTEATFVEVGTWKGRSAAYMAVEIANSGKKIAFYCVDRWDAKGDPWLGDDPDVKSDRLYEVFEQNIAPVRKRIRPLRMSSVEAAELFPRGSVDFVMIDGTHTYAEVKQDIAAWWPRLKPGGVMAGDDLHWEGVEDAVRESFGTFERTSKGRHWRVRKPETSTVEERPYYENIEGLDEWNAAPIYRERRPGISAMVRLKNEADFLALSVASILGWHDEVCLFVQGEQSDRTLEIAFALADAHPGKVKASHYPFESIANGPGHDQQPRGSVYERAYFYNWCMSRTSCEFVDKWDGDMVAHDWLGGEVQRAIDGGREGVYIHGTDLAGPDMRMESRMSGTASELRVHRVTERSWYYTHTHCEHLSIASLPGLKIENFHKVKRPGFLHLKWCKPSIAKSTVGWPEDWAVRHPYYREIVDKKSPSKPYGGEYPRVLADYMAERGL